MNTTATTQLLESLKTFNNTYKVGDTLQITDNNKPRTVTLRWPAEMLNQHQAVIWIKGQTDCIPLNF